MKLIFIEGDHYFLKPDTALLRNNDPFYLPDLTREFTAQGHIVVRIIRLARAIEERFAGRCYDQAGLGIDFTAADLLRRCRAEGLPWEPAKAFDKSAAVSPRSLSKNVLDLPIVSQIDHAISRLSHRVTLRMGDYVFTGARSAPMVIRQGDRLTERLGDEVLIDMLIQ